MAKATSFPKQLGAKADKAAKGKPIEGAKGGAVNMDNNAGKKKGK